LQLMTNFLKYRKTLCGTGLLVLVLTMLVGRWYLHDDQSRIKPVNTLEVTTQAITQRLSLVGRIEPGTLSVVTASFDGSILQKLVEEGQRVERDQVLIRLDTTDVEIRMREALADKLKAVRVVQDMETWVQGQEVARARRALASAKLGLNETERKLVETRTLLDQGIVAKMELDALVQQRQAQQLDVAAAAAELQSALDKGGNDNRQIAQMELANANAKHATLQKLLERQELQAPFAGIIVRATGGSADGPQLGQIQTGVRVGRGQPLFGVASLEQVKVLAKVDEVDINHLYEGQRVDISGDGFEGLPLAGVIASVAAQSMPTASDGGGARYEVTVSTPVLTTEQRQRVRLGMSANLSVILYENLQAIVLPAAAIQTEQGKFFVRLADTQGHQPKTLEVFPGRATEAGVEVVGLTPGMVIMVD